MKNVKNPFILLSFLPAVAFVIFDSFLPVREALIASVCLSVVEIIAEKFFLGHVHKLSMVNFSLIVLFGGVSLLEEDSLWFQLQGTFMGVAIAAVLLYRLKRGKSLMEEMLEEVNLPQRPPPEIMRMVEFHMCLFFLAHACVNAVIALYCPLSWWKFFKIGGFYALMIPYTVVEVILIRRRARSLAGNYPR